MEKRYLPIGSVVKLKNNELTMITGYYAIEYKRDIVVYDYSGCKYPEGLMVKSGIVSFNHRDIDDVLFIGYKNNEFNELNKNLTDIDLESAEELELKIKDEPEILETVKIDTIEETNDFELPHYEFDDKGIIIK